MLSTAITTMPHPKIPFVSKIPRLAFTVMAVGRDRINACQQPHSFRQTTSAPTTLHTTSATLSAAKVAKQQNATLVEYSIITDKFTVNGKQQTQESELYIWVIKPTGEIVFRQVDLKPLWQKDNTSLTNLITSSRQSIGVTHAFTEEQQGLGSALAFAPSKGDDGLLTASEIQGHET